MLSRRVQSLMDVRSGLDDATRASSLCESNERAVPAHDWTKVGGGRMCECTRSASVSAVVSTAIAVGGVSALSLLGLLGALVGGALFELVPEARERGASWLAVAGGLAVGFVGFSLLERALGRASTRQQAQTGARRHPPIVMLNLIGDWLHNAADGSIIAAAFLATPTVGIVTTVAIVLHEIPRELGSFGIFLQGGLSVRRAVAYNALTGTTALLSAAITLLIGTRTTGVATALLPIAAGTFLFIAASVVPGAILRATSGGDRLRRILLATIALVGTAIAAHFG
jgi:zinc transporter ZupT